MNKMAARLQGLYKYRALVRQLVCKDIKLKYRRSFLGYLWSVLNPMMIMVVMYLVFSHMFRFNVENYPAYLIIGQTLFTFMTEAKMCIRDRACVVSDIRGNRELITGTHRLSSGVYVCCGGMRYQPGVIAQLQEALETMRTDHGFRERCGRYNRRRVLPYSQEAVGMRMRAIYNVC